MSDRINSTRKLRELVAWIEQSGPVSVGTIVSAQPPATVTMDRLLRASRLGLIEIDDDGMVTAVDA